MDDDSPPYAVVVDDDVIIRLDAADILADAGFLTFEAPDADAALEILEQHGHAVYLLFTDVQMPGSMNGFALARRCAERWPEISILVASGNAEPAPGEMPPNALFIRKPFSPQVVYDRLQDILPEHRRPPTLLERLGPHR